MLVWFKSDAIIEWGSLLRLSKFVKIKEFQEDKKNHPINGNAVESFAIPLIPVQ